jgi:hypothetical protein
MGPGVRRDECVREDALTERCKSVLELVATPQSKETASP